MFSKSSMPSAPPISRPTTCVGFQQSSLYKVKHCFFNTQGLSIPCHNDQTDLRNSHFSLIQLVKK